MTDQEWGEVWTRLTEAFNHEPGEQVERVYRTYIENRMSYGEAKEAVEIVVEVRRNTLPPATDILRAKKHFDREREWEGEAALQELVDGYTGDQD